VDEDSGRSKKKESKIKKKDGKSRRIHNKQRSQSRGRSKLTKRRTKNKCRHWKEDRPYTGKHADKCFYNKKYKGWRPSKICKELGVTFKRRHGFSSDMGGFVSSKSEESSSGSGSNDSDSTATSDE
jgi:hypothetical protein